VYHWVKFSGVLIHAAAAFAPLSAGRRFASSLSATAPTASVVQALSSPKSVWVSEKSRKMAGTRSAHCPPISSQTAWATQSKPVSRVHVEEQPSPSTRLPSSQSSSMSKPSPQSEVQDRPSQLGSFRQIGEQPSNGVVLPSSHDSAPSCTPLPQMASVHTLGAPSHFLPSSTRQRAEQPSPEATFESSHCSVAATRPSPQRAMLRQGAPGVAQLKPGSVARQ
jgi:hypothetical protein